jgi:hypothetical protein
MSNLHKPIPKSVYYRDGNFFDQTTQIGMGNQFYNLWNSRRLEFPTMPYSEDQAPHPAKPLPPRADKPTKEEFDYAITLLFNEAHHSSNKQNTAALIQVASWLRDLQAKS